MTISTVVVVRTARPAALTGKGITYYLLVASPYIPTAYLRTVLVGPGEGLVSLFSYWYC